MSHVTERAPEIYEHYYPTTKLEDLPAKLERQFKTILRHNPLDVEAGTQQWLDDYLTRLNVKPK